MLSVNISNLRQRRKRDRNILIKARTYAGMQLVYKLNLLSVRQNPHFSSSATVLSFTVGQLARRFVKYKSASKSNLLITF